MFQPLNDTEVSSQAVFDATVIHLFQQGQQAIANQICLYRSPNGMKCAVGVHIRDDEYSEKMENKMVINLKDANLLPSRLIPHLKLLIDLQDFHDDSDNWRENDRTFKNKLKAIAEKYRLSSTIIDEWQKPIISVTKLYY